MVILIVRVRIQIDAESLTSDRHNVCLEGRTGMLTVDSAKRLPA